MRLPSVLVNSRHALLAALAVLAVLALVLVTVLTAKEVLTRMPVQQAVAPQAGELAARLRIVGGMRLETIPVKQGSPSLMELAGSFGLEELPPATIHHMIEVTARVMASFGMPNQNERTDYWSVPGLRWEAGRLVNEWSGAVRLFRKGDFILVAYDKVPDDLCQRMQLGSASLTSYVFACNDTIHLVENGHSAIVDATHIRPSPKSI